MLQHRQRKQLEGVESKLQVELPTLQDSLDYENLHQKLKHQPPFLNQDIATLKLGSKDHKVKFLALDTTHNLDLEQSSYLRQLNMDTVVLSWDIQGQVNLNPMAMVTLKLDMAFQWRKFQCMVLATIRENFLDLQIISCPVR